MITIGSERRSPDAAARSYLFLPFFLFFPLFFHFPRLYICSYSFSLSLLLSLFLPFFSLLPAPSISSVYMCRRSENLARACSRDRRDAITLSRPNPVYTFRSIGGLGGGFRNGKSMFEERVATVETLRGILSCFNSSERDARIYFS